LLINRKNLGGKAAIFPALPPLRRDFVLEKFTERGTVFSESAPYQVRIWFDKY
jgi:hypothetical protein